MDKNNERSVLNNVEKVIIKWKNILLSIGVILGKFFVDEFVIKKYILVIYV